MLNGKVLEKAGFVFVIFTHEKVPLSSTKKILETVIHLPGTASGFLNLCIGTNPLLETGCHCPGFTDYTQQRF